MAAHIWRVSNFLGEGRTLLPNRENKQHLGNDCEQDAVLEMGTSQSGNARRVTPRAVSIMIVAVVTLLCCMWIPIHKPHEVTSAVDPDSVSMLATNTVAAVAALYGGINAGKGTHIQVGEHDLGLCGYRYKWFPKDMPRVTVSAKDVDGSKACGMCIKVWGEGVRAHKLKSETGKIFLVNNICDYCKKGNLGFALDETVRHNVDIFWKAVPCPVEKSIKYFIEGSSEYYVKVKPFNFTYPVAKMELKGSKMAKWVVAKTPIPGYYEANSQSASLEFPLDVRVTSITGEVIEEKVIKLMNGKVQPGNKNAQFTKPFNSKGMVLAPNGCKGPGENCNFSKCCTVPEHTCFKKNKKWASCRETCKAGEVDPQDPKGHRKPWNCTVLGHYGCSKVGHDCSQTQCCQDKKLTCFEKNHKWAACKPSCEPGKPDKYDVPEERTPWSCAVLSGSAIQVRL